ncbi:hypothetical protein A0H81_09027 [Grifola frondosa]|uniref:NFX1-type zinc finger-containing protein 1 n=1 Tax=Grifola frondosa TaxID=5627 RepID=A0A1C7M1Z6_GRIFR|nr:hypothetical protein A0H81_09027 [Grifola frondosa]
MRAIAPFLTTEALARVSGAGTDGYFSDLSSLSPTAQNVYAFLALIGNANSGNVKWAPEDGQLLLSAIGTGNGILRLNDIIAWSEVSISPSNKLVLSFQRGYLPLLRYLSSDFVVKSITSQVVNALYTLVMHNFDHFTEVIEKCIADAFTSRSQVFASLAKVLFEYLTRFKNAVATHPSLHQFVLNFREWSETWIAGVSSTPATFHDPLADASVQARDFIIQRLRAQIEQLEQLVAIVERKHREVERAQGRIREVSVNTTTTAQEGILAALENGYEGPGNLRPQGPRHDNDFADIANIRIAPTHDELASRHDPFLPANIFGAPHPLFADSMERLLDIQFRLLREELTASLRTSTQLVVEDLQEKRRATRLDDLMKKGGGKYRGHVAGQDTIMFNVYTNVDFSPFTPDRRGLSVGVSLDAPPGRARSNQSRARIAFWENLPPAYALLPSFTFELSSLFPPEAGIDNLKLSVQDPQSVEAARDALRKNSRLDPSQADSVIEALTRELVLIQGPPGTGKSYTGVELLRVLLANGAGPVLMIAFTNHALDHMLRSVLDANITRKIVRLGSRSADERIAEFSLENVEKVIGKSRLDRAFSAEYRALRDVEEEITRFMQESLKTGVDSEQIRQYLRFQSPTHFESLSSRSWSRGKVDTSDDSSLYAYWRTGQDLEFVQSALYSFTHPDPPPAVIQQPVLNRYEVLAPSSQRASAEPQADSEESSEDDDDDDDDEAWDIAPEEAWELAPIDPDTIEDDSMESEIEVEYLESIAPSNAPPDTGPPSPEAIKPTDFADIEEFFHTFGCAEIPRIPSSQRPSSELLEEDDIWTMSLREREQLHRLWTDEVRVSLQATRTDEFQRLRDRHTTALRNHNEGKDEIRRQMLRNVDIIGCTTTGAAKLTALLKGIGPRVMLVEEAGQVLEAHVLGSLVPSIQHLILIGDPLQLRPTLNNYSLSMDHRRGRMLFKFDMSLMERLATSGLPMSQINVQRRMRPEIADLVRNTLYPKLEDHDLVKVYPSVKGMAKNVFFMTHNHKENGGEDDFVSKYNTFEVEMIKDLVLYLLRQGSYSAEGDIVVLCAYLGQLSKLRDVLSNEVAVVIDERDQAELNERDAEREDVDASMSTVEHVKVSRRVLLRTIDNYQGEEAKIIILSLVRNAGGSEEDDAVYGHSSNVRPNIGFLKSENRTNVALSRAREGLYILGNATNLASRSSMWRTVLEELGKEECLGDAFPVICQRHPNNVEEVSRPGQLPMIAPDGGCLLQCDMRLNCGHLCPYKCHSDDPKHLAVACVQRCTRLCPRGHPCAKPCADPCGKCLTPVSNVELPCGHVKSTVYCYQLDDLSEVSCSIVVTRRLPQCEHDASMMCSDDPARFICRVPNIRWNDSNTWFILARDRCSVGIDAVNPVLKTTNVLRCARGPAAKFVDMLVAETIAPRLVHPVRNRVLGGVHTTHVPFLAARYAHVSRVINAVSARWHVVTDVLQFVAKTASSKYVPSRTLADIDPDSDALDEIIITLPNCRHVFTVETLDGHCEMTEYYKCDSSDGKWLGLEAPPVGFKNPPACPTCRSAITSPRYGRIFKRADLDILENNVAFYMSQSLKTVYDKIDLVSKADLENRLAADAINLSVAALKSSVKELKAKQKSKNAILNATRVSPVAVQDLDLSNQRLHGLPASEAKAFKRVLNRLLAAYSDTVVIARTRSAHSHAWEASFAYLYQKEMDDAASDPARAPRNPHEHAMRMARLKVGQPQPRADKRFLVEAFWTTITIRLTLADFAGKWLEALAKRAKYPPENRRMWATSVSTSRWTRQNGNTGEGRNNLADSAKSKSAEASKYAAGVIAAHQQARRVRQTPGEEDWLTTDFSRPAKVILDEWRALERSLRSDTFYEPVSLEELTEIVKGLNFSHTGHFYKCPNGHVFVITECGGANERSICLRRSFGPSGPWETRHYVIVSRSPPAASRVQGPAASWHGRRIRTLGDIAVSLPCPTAPSIKFGWRARSSPVVTVSAGARRRRISEEFGCVPVALQMTTLIYLSSSICGPNIQRQLYCRTFGEINFLGIIKQDFFGGIPFAEAPIGQRRFSPPVFRPSLDLPVFNASEFGAPCPQQSVTNFTDDCLTVNILRPTGIHEVPLPVMVWIYGGGFSGGFAAERNASALVMQSVLRGTPIIYVNFNYRTGPFGFPQGVEAASRGALNLGLKDQLTALEWIQRNIASFGGDPEKVTLFGQSAGAISITDLFLHSGLEKLIRAAIIESGSPASTNIFNASRREQEWQHFVSATPQCAGASANNTFDCLRQTNISTLMNAYAITTSETSEIIPFSPVMDGPDGLIPDLPSRLLAAGKFARIPLIAGTNLDEGTSFVVPRDVTSEAQISEFIILEDAPFNNGSVPNGLNETINVLLELYPDDPALGCPFGTGNDTFGLSSEYKQVAAIAGDVIFHALRRQWTQTMSKFGVKVFSYLFTDPQAVTDPSLGVTHAVEIPYVYGSPFINGPMPASNLSLAMMDYWISFAVSLDPNDGRGSSRLHWLQYKPDRQVLLQLNGQNTTHIPDNFRSQQISFINAHPEALDH